MDYREIGNGKVNNNERKALIERKRTEAELEKSLSLLQATLDATADGIIVFDRKQNISCYNSKFIEMWNIYEDILAENNNRCMLNFLLEQLENPEAYAVKESQLYFQPEIETWDILRLKNGKIFKRYSKPQWLNNKIVGRVLSFRDVTEAKQAEMALKHSEEKYRMLFNNAKDGIALVTLDENQNIKNIIEINDIACQWLGLTKEQLLIMSSEDISVIAKKSGFTPQYHYQDSAEQHFWYELTHLTKDGRQLQLEMNVHRFELKGHKVSLGIARDITERKRFEREMARLDQLNLVGEMAAGIGHEVRNPMTTVRGFVQMLLSKNDCRQYWEYYKIMIEELDRANAIITEFLSLAKNRAISLQNKNINLIVKSLLPLIEADAILHNKYVKVDLSEIPDVLLDDKEIRQLILNLVRNGLEATSPGGYVTIKTYVEGEDVVLVIKDQGKGIDSQVLGKIGTPFFTTKENGTGLGLAICYSIVARHNAVISIDTSEKGTAFMVKLNSIKSDKLRVC